MRVLVGAVGYRNLGDLSAAPDLLPALLAADWEPGIDVEDLSYGPIAVVQNLEDRPPYDRMVLVSAVRRDRAAGRLYRYVWADSRPGPEEIQARIGEAVTGVIGLDNLLVIARHFGVLAPEVIVFEIEPVSCESGRGYSPAVQALLPGALQAVIAEAHARSHSTTAR